MGSGVLGFVHFLQIQQIFWFHLSSKDNMVFLGFLFIWQLVGLVVGFLYLF